MATAKWSVRVFVFVALQVFAGAQAAGFAELDEARISAIARTLPATPAGFGAPCTQRSDWDAPARRDRLKAVVTAAEKLLAQPFPLWDEAAYLEYSRIGQRRNGERMMNGRKAWLYPLVLAECAEWRGRFLPAIEITLRELSAQPSWTWPAHDRTLRNLRGDFEVDLFAADLAHDLAQSLYMLGERLPTDLRAQTLAALDIRVLQPVRRSIESGNKDHWWLKADHNWNAVCLKGVVLTALAVLPQREDRAVFAAAGEHYIKRYVAGFSSDGYTTEGPGYWNYGFSHLVELRHALHHASGGGIELFAGPKLRNMALYAERIEMMPGNIAAFGDASPTTRMDAVSVNYARQALALGQFRSLASLPISTSQSGNQAPLATAALLLFGDPVPPAPVTEGPAAAIGRYSYFDQVGVLVLRPDAGARRPLGASIKAGGNGNHSHNDIGSYTIALGAEQPTGDVGATAYSARTFSKDRYTIRGINSWGHPVPVVGGVLQSEATKLRPKVLQTSFEATGESISIDLQSAYAVPALRSLQRSLHYQRSDAPVVTVEDRFEFDSPQSFEGAITTRGSWQLRPDRDIELWQMNERLLARIEASAAYDLVAEKVDEEGLVFTRIGIRLREPQRSGFIRLRYQAAPAP